MKLVEIVANVMLRMIARVKIVDAERLSLGDMELTILVLIIRVNLMIDSSQVCIVLCQRYQNIAKVKVKVNKSFA